MRGGRVSVVGHVVKGHGHVVPAVVMDARARAAEIVAAAVAERERARAEGFALGRDEGRADAAAALVGLLAAARAEAEAALARVEPAASAIAARMAERIVGRAVDLDPTLMAALAAEAVAACRTRGGVAQLRVHPDDLAPVVAARAALAEALGGQDALEIVADESVGRYGCVVDTAVGRVDARLTTQLEALCRALSSPDAEGARRG
ncbi:MAG TPA: FliH/SctL family protein [Polyangia bacterium]|nr:FliH/SctL family protein [Polyangia bacterium]